jgi:hypothetical protein
MYNLDFGWHDKLSGLLQALHRADCAAGPHAPAWFENLEEVVEEGGAYSLRTWGGPRLRA